MNEIQDDNSRFRFRAWDKRYKTMCNVSDISLLDNFISVDTCTENIYGGDFILMQSTGLLDLNKKLIYEGDLVKIPECQEDDCLMKEWIGVVVFVCGSYMAGHPTKNQWDEIDISDIEIIGNKYESPELIK